MLDDRWALVDTPDSELWMMMLDDSVSTERHCWALEELVEREDKRLPPFVVRQLAQPSLVPQWQDALVEATPRISVIDAALRGSLADSLWNYASEWLDEPEREGQRRLWTAIHRYATLRPQADIGRLVVFLTSFAQNLPLVHVVLLAAANAFSGWPPMESERVKLEQLSGRIVDLARRYLDPARLQTSDERVVALAAYCAAAALALPEVEALTARMLSLNKGWLIDLAWQDLAEMLSRWQQRKDASDFEDVVGLVGRVVEQLSEAAKGS